MKRIFLLLSLFLIGCTSLADVQKECQILDSGDCKYEKCIMDKTVGFNVDIRTQTMQGYYQCKLLECEKRCQ